jgi:hypothetical protein
MSSHIIKTVNKSCIYHKGKNSTVDYDTLSFESSKVGMKMKGDVEDKNFRNSWVCKDDFEIKLDKKIHKLLLQLIPSAIHALKPEFGFVDCVLLKYSTDCVFKKHVDNDKCPSHIATGLIYPPQEYNGGRLIINDDVELNPNNWDFVAIKIGIPHEVTKITAGTRYVYKFNILCSDLENLKPTVYNDAHGDVDKIDYKSYIKYMRKKNSVIIQRDLEILSVKNKMYDIIKNINKQYEQKLLPIVGKIESIKEISYGKWLPLIRTIKKDYESSACIILQTYYKFPQPDSLCEDDLLLYNGLITEISGCKIQFRLALGKYMDYDKVDEDGMDPYLYCFNIDDDIDKCEFKYSEAYDDLPIIVQKIDISDIKIDNLTESVDGYEYCINNNTGAGDLLFQKEYNWRSDTEYYEYVSKLTAMIVRKN